MSSMKEVAKLAGVSISTVSRVINNSVPVEEETRKRVEKAIKKLNYKPNLLAKGLRIKSGRLIGLVVPGSVYNHAFASFIDYIESNVSNKGYNLILGHNRNDPDSEAEFIDMLIRRNVDGIILSRVSDESRVLRMLGNNKIPVVVIDRAFSDESVPSVVLDNYRAGVLAAKHFIEERHKVIACLTGPLNISLCRDRMEGFRETLKNHNIEFSEDDIYEGDFKYESGADFVKKIMSKKKRYTAIWAQNDLMAIGIINHFLKNGYNIPKDISVVGMDDISFSSMMVPSLTTVGQPFSKMCKTAVDVIYDQIRGKNILKKRFVFQPYFVSRETTMRIG